ncbi:MAG: 4-(cytidine 5'-diphospho)-2-C-methyl-D-erythritol kinase [Planctomycetaceae bacterium]
MMECGNSLTSPSTTIDCGFKSRSDNAVTLDCPAKLNLFLEVLGKRPDGYHELETVMLRTQFSDQLTARPTLSPELSLRFSDATAPQNRSGIPLDESNLILKAAAAVRKKLSTDYGAEFILHKRIPPESGLAGGSSNAATALLLCRKIWQSSPGVQSLSNADLHEIAASLGSDINFLLSGVPAAICRGRGEMIEPIALAHKFFFVAVRPKSGNSTASVFRATVLPAQCQNSSAVVSALAGQGSLHLHEVVFNRLTSAAQKTNHEMAALMARLGKLAKRPVFMSGSGSTVFVIAKSRNEAAQIQLQVKQTFHMTAWILESASSVADTCELS